MTSGTAAGAEKPRGPLAIKGLRMIGSAPATIHDVPGSPLMWPSPTKDEYTAAAESDCDEPDQVSTQGACKRSPYTVLAVPPGERLAGDRDPRDTKKSRASLQDLAIKPPGD
jgi:hypothetical protein